MVSEAVQCGLRLSSRLGAYAGHVLATEDAVGRALQVVCPGGIGGSRLAALPVELGSMR